MRLIMSLLGDVFIVLAGLIGGILITLVGTAGVPAAKLHPIFHLKGWEYVAALLAAAALAALLRLAARRVA